MDKKFIHHRGKPFRGGSKPKRIGHGQSSSEGRGRGTPGRKGGASLYDESDMYDVDNDNEDYFEPPVPRINQQPTFKKSFSQNANVTQSFSNDVSTQAVSRNFRGRDEPGSVRRNPVKVIMQHLYMSSENQELVKDMLKDLHGSDLEIDRQLSDEECNDLAGITERQYWMDTSQLKLEESVPKASQEDDDIGDINLQVSPLALKKLMRYGFHKTRCIEALLVCDGDLGLALEYLLAECFDLKNIGGEDLTERKDFTEQRNEEIMALLAIYENKFIERLKDKVWILKLALPYLDKIIMPKRETKSSEVHVDLDTRDRCRFFLQGFCKFGQRCRMKHSVAKEYKGSNESVNATDKVGEDFEHELEIRFPNGNRYPEEIPYIAFCSTSKFLNKHVCLNITKHLIAEARKMASSGQSSIFTVVSLLNDETFLDNVIKEPAHEFSCPPYSQACDNYYTHNQTISLQDTDTKNDFDMENLAYATESVLGMTEGKTANMKIKDVTDNDVGKVTIELKRCTSIEEQKKISKAELFKTNKLLIEDFNRRKTYGKYKVMQETRHQLPAWDMQEDILQAIDQNQVVVISGMTGCGKTTQVPQFILDQYLNSGDLQLCNILCTQPRRISAIAVAERVADERSDFLGRIIGYQIRLENLQSSWTRLLFCTTGIVLRRLEKDPTLDGVTHLLIDEVHERSEESDFLLMYLKDMLPKRPNLKVILMSATMNAGLFSNYFCGCAIIDIPGRTFSVAQYFLEDAVEFTRFVMEESSPYARPLKYMNAVQRGIAEEEESASGPTHKASDRVQDQNLTIKQLYLRYSDYHKSTVDSMAMMDHTKINFDLVLELLQWFVQGDHSDLELPKGGAILVFMPGYAEIQTFCDALFASPVIGGRNKHKYNIIPLHSTLSSEEQHVVFSKPPSGVTKIVIATNIAETSITIDDVCCVIDTGKMKEKRYDSLKGMESLDTVWVSQANALQRKGRAGRVQSGVCFHLFTKHRFEHHLLEQPIPEIQRAPLEQIVLRIRMLDIFKRIPVQEVLHTFPEPPDDESITSAVNRLELLGALDNKGELTPLGYHLGTLPVDVRIGKLMLLGAIFQCLDPTLTIAACLSFKSPFVTPFGKKQEATTRKLKFAAGNSDHLTMLNAYNAWMEVRKTSAHKTYRFCQDNFLSSRSLEMLASMKQQFVELLSDIGFVREGISAKDVVKAAHGGDDGVVISTGEQANLNCQNLKLVSALLVGALYPNIVQVLTPEKQYAQVGGGSVAVNPKVEDLRFKTKQDGYVRIHPSSVNFRVRHFESPYLVYHEKVKTTSIYIRDSTMVSVYPLLLFGGGQISKDLIKGNFVLSVDDDWIRFMAESNQIAELVRELRLQLDNLLSDKIKNPHIDLCTCPRGSRIINTIVKLITTQG